MKKTRAIHTQNLMSTLYLYINKIQYSYNDNRTIIDVSSTIIIIMSNGIWIYGFYICVDADSAGKKNLDKIMYTKYIIAVYIEYTTAKCRIFSLYNIEKKHRRKKKNPISNVDFNLHDTCFFFCSLEMEIKVAK